VLPAQHQSKLKKKIHEFFNTGGGARSRESFLFLYGLVEERGE